MTIKGFRDIDIQMVLNNPARYEVNNFS